MATQILNKNIIIKYPILGFGKIIGGIIREYFPTTMQGELPIRHVTFSEEL
jgi:hypothetical protein